MSRCVIDQALSSFDVSLMVKQLLITFLSSI
jgi:hypothetical protein